MLGAPSAPGPPAYGVAPPPPPSGPGMGGGYVPVHSQQQHRQGQASGAPAARPSGQQHHGGSKQPPPGFRVPSRNGSSSHKPHAAPPAQAPVGNVVPMAAENRLRRDTPFLAHIRFRNDLPEIPSDPKMLVSQIQPELLSRFSLTALERQARRDLLTPPAIVVSPLDVQRYQVPENPGPMDPADAALLKDDARPLALGGSPLPLQTDGRHRSFAARAKGMDMEKCSWLMRTTYISSSDNRGVQRQGIPEKVVLQTRAQERRSASKQERELNDRDAQVTAIEQSFEYARQPPVHPRNPALKPVEVLPVLPDMEAWPQKLLLTTFLDSDPAEEVAAVVGGKSVESLPPAKRPHLLVGHYLLKGFTHHTTKAGKERELKIMALLVREDVEDMVARTVQQEQARAAAEAEGAPPEQVAAAGAGMAPEDLEGDYQWTKDYNYELKRDSVHYAIRLGRGGAQFYRMQGKLELRSWRDEEKLARDRARKRVMGRADSEEPGDEDEGPDVQRPSKIHVVTRELNDREMQEREEKRQELAAPEVY